MEKKKKKKNKLKVLPVMFSPFDPFGSWTGVSMLNPYEIPIQDADDL